MSSIDLQILHIMSLTQKIVLLILLLFKVECYGADLFKVDNIYVSENTGDYIDSKSIAIINGSKEALKTLILRLNASSDNFLQHMNCIDDLKSPEKFIKNYEILSERVTSKSYSANINFIFNKDDIEGVMNLCGFKYSSTSPGATLLIPIIKNGSNYRILDKESQDNEIRSAVNSIPNKIGVLNMEKAYIDKISDVENLDLNILMNGSYREILNILKKYNRSSLILLSVNDLTSRSVSLYLRFISNNEEYSNNKEYLIQPGETKQQFLKRAFGSFIKEADSSWKRGFSSPTEVVYNSGVTVELSEPSQWNKLNNILRNINSVKQYKFKAISADSVEIDLKYVTSPEELSRELLKYNVGIFKREDRTIMKFIK